MPISCDPGDLIKAAACFDKCIPEGMKPAVITYLLALMAGGSTDPNVLMQQAKTMKTIPAGMQAEVQTYLLCQLVNA
jgi:hypothetical protein